MKDYKEKRLIKIGYTAGILDGEGSIQINPGNYPNNRYNYLAPSIQISSNHKLTLMKLKNYWKIGTITSWISKNSPKKNISYNWRIYGRKNIEKFLKILVPFLSIKKQKAKLMLEFCKYCPGRGKNLSKQQLKKRGEIFISLRKLNQRGKGNRKSYAKKNWR